MPAVGDQAASWIKDEPDGVSLQVRVIPRAGRTVVDGIRGDRLLLRIAAAPVRGAANEALVTLLARALRVPPSAIHVTAGASGRNKTARIRGVTAADCAVLVRTPRPTGRS